MVTVGVPPPASRRLADATFSVRPVEPGDAPALAAFYAGLSPDARHARFMATLGAISELEATHFATADHRTREGLVAVLREAGPRDGEIVGHLCLEPAGAAGVEFGVVVAGDQRRRGIGTALLERGRAWALARGFRRLAGTTLVDNVAMLRLARDLGGSRVRTAGAGVVSLELTAGGTGAAGRPTPPGPGSTRRAG